MKNSFPNIPFQRIYPFFLGVISLAVWSACTHEPQESSAPPVEEQKITQISVVEEINRYVTALLDEKKSLESRRSLMFGAGDYVFDGVLYEKEGALLIAEENGEMGEYGYVKRRFVLKNGTPVLVREEEKVPDMDNGGYFFRETRYYYLDGQFFRAMKREAEDVRFLSSGEFEELEPEETDFSADLQRVQDAVQEQGEFVLTFQELIEVSGQTYMLLGDPFTTSLRVITEDETFRQIEANPAAFKGRELKISWEFRILEGTKEAVYLGGEMK